MVFQYYQLCHTYIFRFCFHLRLSEWHCVILRISSKFSEIWYFPQERSRSAVRTARQRSEHPGALSRDDPLLREPFSRFFRKFFEKSERNDTLSPSSGKVQHFRRYALHLVAGHLCALILDSLYYNFKFAGRTLRAHFHNRKFSDYEFLGHSYRSFRLIFGAPARRVFRSEKSDQKSRRFYRSTKIWTEKA